MADILCAIRAGEGSRAVQNAAISMARKSGARLAFLYVIDRRVIESSDDVLRPIVRRELYWMGKTLLNIAAHRARAAGLETVELYIREGDVGEEIGRAVAAAGVGLVMIGASRHHNSTAGPSTVDFADWVRTTTGATVEIVTVPAPHEAVAPLRAER